jgi:hypothetical protein
MIHAGHRGIEYFRQFSELKHEEINKRIVLADKNFYCMGSRRFFSKENLKNPKRGRIMKNCEKCRFRGIYDRNPKSLLGRIWKWHIGWCPGWRSYLRSLSAEEREQLKRRYSNP